MNVYSWRSVCLLMLLISSCGKSLPELKGIDIESWKADKNGCSRKREPFIENIREQKNELLSLNEMQVVEILGSPDRNELYKRNQKFYYYYLQPSENCPTSASHPLRLSIRFNAMGLAKEISLD
ncbi:MAG TPA: hypothetical protein VGK59_00780 [Ohtaekwangia sp.]